jgi:peptidyl-prolyl cis-trans isomerase B (cyclophilin B)
VHSFLSLAKQGDYTGTSCHRLAVEGLQMPQCGDPTGTGTSGPGYSFKDEIFHDQRGRGHQRQPVTFAEVVVGP